MKRLSFCCLLMAFVCLHLSAEQPSPQPFRQADYRGASFSYVLLDAETGELCVSHRPEQVLSSASIVKLLTTATALEVLGPDYAAETRLYYQGKIQDGVLHGDVWLLPLGDPTLGSALFHEHPFAFLDEWTAALQKAGIRQVKGSVRLLDAWADEQAVSPYWLWEDLGNYYAAGVYSAAIYENALDLYLSSDGVGEAVSLQKVYPSFPSFHFDVKAFAADNNKDSAYVYGVPYQYQRQVFGSIPAHRNAFRVRADNPDPNGSLRWLWQEHLQKAGISISGALAFDEGVMRVSDFDAFVSEEQLRLFHTHRSLSLREMIRQCNVRSNNLLAEYLARHAAWRLGADLPLSATESLRAMLSFWQDKGLDVSDCFLKDACGLAPQTAFSASFLAAVLQYMSQESVYADVFLSSIPLAGKEGTLRSLAVDVPGSLRLKSGSMSGVRCYAGYYTLPALGAEPAGSAAAPPASRYILVLMINRANVPTARLLSDIRQWLKASLPQ